MLEPIDYMNGIMTTIVVAICFITGFRIAYRYKMYKQRVFIFFGITWAGMSTIYIPLLISFYGILITGQGLPLFGYLIIDSFTPLIVSVGVMAWSEIIDFINKYQKPIIISFNFVSLGIFVYFLYNTFNNPTILGILERPLVIRYLNFVAFYLIFTAVVAMFTGTVFFWQSREAFEPEVRLKGLLIWFAFILFFLGTLLDGFLPITEETIFISRLVLIVGSACFLFGFFPPKFALTYVKERIEKEKKES